MDSITIASLNCQGLGDPRKRRDVFHYLRQKKYSIYCLQDTHFTRKLENYITSEWGYKCVFASYRSNSRGVAILFSNTFEFKINDVKRDANGNFLIISFALMEKELILINVYGPNRDEPMFYTTLKESIKRYKNNNIIAVGDWNIVMDPNVDSYNYVHVNNPKAREAVENMMEELDIADVWRENNPESRRYTWRKPTPLKQGRLDFFLLSDHLYWYFEDTDILPGYRSDHSMVTLKLKFGKYKGSKGYWKFNTSLLRDTTFLDLINEEISLVTKEYSFEDYNEKQINEIPLSEVKLQISDKLFLDFLLMKVRAKTIAYATMKRKQTEEKENNLIRHIEALEKTEDKTENEIQELQEKNHDLKTIREKRMEGVLVRSKARWIANGENISKYFCSLEKRNYTSKHILKLINNKGSILENEEEIQSEVLSFYENLYKKRDVDDCVIGDLVKTLPILTNIEQQSLEGEITLNEASHALKNMKNDKSPGTDGFSAEFF